MDPDFQIQRGADYQRHTHVLFRSPSRETFAKLHIVQGRITMNFVAIDFETANYAQDSACAVGLVKVVDGEIVDSVAHLIQPPTREFVFTYIHGLTWKHVAGSPHFGGLWPKLGPWLEGVDFLAAHNAPFDKGVLRACCATYEIAAPLPEFRCTVALARRAWNVRPTKLPDVCRHLGIALDHHDALSDAMACAKIVIAAERAAAEASATASVRGAGQASRVRGRPGGLVS